VDTNFIALKEADPTEERGICKNGHRGGVVGREHPGREVQGENWVSRYRKLKIGL